MTPAQVFEAWGEHKLRLDRGACKEESLPIYRAIWEGWLRWLTTRDVPPGAGALWTRAQPEHVLAFIDGPAPAVDRRRRRPKRDTAMANYTRQRYWSVLRDIYAFASNPDRAWCPANPALESEIGERPMIARRDREAQVLPAGVLDLLRKPEELLALLPKKADTSWWVDRDRAVMALLVHFGLTKRELMDLQGRDLCVGSAPFDPAGIQLDAEQSALEVSLDVRIVGEDDLRIGAPFAVPKDVVDLITPWLLERRRLLASQRARSTTAGPDVEQPLFLARIPGPDGCLPAVEQSTIYQLVNRCLARAYRFVNLPPDAVVAKGPAIVRNAVVSDWISHRGPDEAARLAGVASARSLRHSKTAAA